MRFRIAIGAARHADAQGPLRSDGRADDQGLGLSLRLLHPRPLGPPADIAQGGRAGTGSPFTRPRPSRRIGTAASNGCMRTTDAVMRRLFKAVTLGATVLIQN